MSESLTSSERISELWPLLTHNQRRFVVEMTQCATKKDAAEAISLDPRTVYNWPSIVDEAVELLLADARAGAVEMLTQALTRAVMIKISGLDSNDEKIRQAAASEIIDRGLGKATQHTELSGPEGGPLKYEHALTDEERAERIAAIFDAARDRRDRQAGDE